MKVKLKEHMFEEYKTVFGTNDFQLELINILNNSNIIPVSRILDDRSWATELVYSINIHGIQKISIPLEEQKYFYVVEF